MPHNSTASSLLRIAQRTPSSIPAIPHNRAHNRDGTPNNAVEATDLPGERSRCSLNPRITASSVKPATQRTRSEKRYPTLAKSRAPHADNRKIAGPLNP